MNDRSKTHIYYGWFAVVFCFLFLCARFGVATEPNASRMGTLRLSDGDVFKGEFESNDNQVRAQDLATNKENASSPFFHWRCPTFREPLQANWNKVESITFDRRNTVDHAKHNNERFVLEFWSGDCITGTIESLNSEIVVLRSDRFGEQAIALGAIRTVLRIVDGDGKEAGSLSPQNWQQIHPSFQAESDRCWFPKVGSITTETAGTAVAQEIYIPDVSAMDVDVAWTHSSPNWVLTLGSPRKLELHVRKIEHRNSLSVTLLFEENENADIATVIIPFDGLESIRLRVLSDYIRGRFALQRNGETIGEIRGKEKLRSGGKQTLKLTNTAQGGLVLRELRVTRSIYSVKDVAKGNDGAKELLQPKIMLRNSEDYTGAISDFRSSDRTFSLAGSARSLGRIAIADVERMEFSESESSVRPADAKWPVRDTESSEFCFVELEHGERFSGKSLHQTGDTLRILGSPIAESIPCELDRVVSIQYQRIAPKTSVSSERSERRSRLTTPDASSYGSLAESPLTDGTANVPAIRWKATNIEQPVAFRLDASGTIDFFEAIEDLSATQATLRVRASNNRVESYGRMLEPGEPSLYLVSGDSVPANIESLRDGVLSLGSSYFGNAKIDASLVKGIRNLVFSGADTIAKDTLNRLLMVPRAQRSNPPTHLIVSREGDAVRGRLLEMDTDTLLLEVRGEERRLWMKNIAEVIWLEPAPSLNKSTASPETTSDDGNSITSDGPLTFQVLLGLGTRISLIPSAIRSATIEGKHPQLGEAKVPLGDCSRIVFGEEIATTAKTSRFAKWKLRHAIDPKFVEDEQSDGAMNANSLVGKAAPPISVERLDGSKLELDQLQGKVTVLDFWASWCGPCMKSLPEVIRLTKEFEEDVVFVAVNVDEAQQLVRANAAALDMVSNVAMDTNGVASKAYGASSIPFTVIIDRAGVVRNVFVGAGEDTPLKMREAIAKAMETTVP
jgi:thiol-disulfide isomerase/thioredoxin